MGGINNGLSTRLFTIWVAIFAIGHVRRLAITASVCIDPADAQPGRSVDHAHLFIFTEKIVKI